MNFYIIIPAHNEEDCIEKTLQSLAAQTLLPKQLVVVNDNSTDTTHRIVEDYASEFPWISLVNTTSTNQHLPGSKIINAFNKGLETLDGNYDVICKFDADLIFPSNYLEQIANHFKKDNSIGIVGGLAYIKKNTKWIYENIADKTHVRGPIKAYRKECFKNIGGLKQSIGWDTVDTLLAKYHNWKVFTDKNLHVKHLKPTGENYSKNSKYLQGEALYKMRYGFLLMLISALKMGFNKRSFKIIKNYTLGYFKAKSCNTAFIVSKSEGKFIRKLRWKGIFNKIIPIP